MLKSLLIFFCFIFITGKSFSQSWLPEPVKNSYTDALAGNWTSSPYVFMGNTNTEEVSYNMILNGQYMEVDFKRTDDKGFTYSGKEIITFAADGTMKGTYFDILGKDRNSTYTGSTDGSKVILTSESLVGNGMREIVIDGDTMTQNVTFTMPDKNVNEMQEQKITITYTRTK